MAVSYASESTAENYAEYFSPHFEGSISACRTVKARCGMYDLYHENTSKELLVRVNILSYKSLPSTSNHNQRSLFSISENDLSVNKTYPGITLI